MWVGSKVDIVIYVASLFVYDARREKLAVDTDTAEKT